VAVPVHHACTKVVGRVLLHHSSSLTWPSLVTGHMPLGVHSCFSLVWPPLFGTQPICELFSCLTVQLLKAPLVKHYNHIPYYLIFMYFCVVVFVLCQPSICIMFTSSFSIYTHMFFTMTRHMSSIAFCVEKRKYPA